MTAPSCPARATQPDLHALSLVMRRLAIEAGHVIMEVYDRPSFAVQSKSDASPVTEADEAADRLISAGLKAAFPDLALVTEEQAKSHSIRADDFLIVDPLDGTKEFIQRRGDFTVNIAWVSGNRPVLGVVYAPAKERLFYTLAQEDGQVIALEESKTASGFALDQIGATRAIHTNPSPDNRALMVVASKSHRDQATDDYIGRYHVKDSKSAGSSLKFCLVATGEADLYPRLGPTMEWDTAAGDAILRASGGSVIDFDDHLELTYGKAGFRNPFFIAHAQGVVLAQD